MTKRKDKIIVSLTTWKKRDKVAVKALEHFQNQSLKPDKIILWLSESEYGGQIPSHLQKCLDNQLVTEIRFDPGNTRCYKRWEVFKEYDQAYVIMIDDDYYYPEDYVESLYKAAKKTKLPCCYYEKTFDYIGTKRVEIEYEQGSIKNNLYPGFCCIPPGIIKADNELFDEKFVTLRDKYNPVSDDLWYSLWFKKQGIPVYGLKKWNNDEVKKFQIEDSQKEGLWESTNRKQIEGVSNVVRNFATLVDAIDDDQFITQLYPEFEFKKCSRKQDIDKDYESSVSIIMTAYKARRFIKQAIDSVYSQTYFKTHDKWELLIGVDDCEETLDYLKSLMNKYDHHLRVFMMNSNKGTYITSNTLLKISKYNWVIRFDSDDVLKNTTIEKLFKECPGYDCCVYRYTPVNEYMSNKEIAPVSNMYHNGSIFVKSSVIKQLGGYEPWPVSADAELIFCRIRKFFKVKCIEDPLLYYRIHHASLTHNAATNGKSEIRKTYNTIWKNRVYDKLSDAIIECETNTYQEVYANDQYLAVDVFDLNIDTKIKTVVYTCVLDGTVPPEIEKQDNVDYVCFSNVMIKSDSWKVVIIPSELYSLSSAIQKEIVKICPHKYLSEYDLSIYVEPDKLNKMFDFKLVPGKSVYMKGNDRGCIYKLAKRMLQDSKDSYSIRTHIFKYQQENYPSNNGLADTDIIIRLHNDNYCIKLMERWKSEVLRCSCTDQLSFNYCLWRVGDTGFNLISEQRKSILR